MDIIFSSDFLIHSTDLRPDAKKVLVIIIDKKSDSTEDEVRQAADLLENDKIRVIPVALGKEADIPELTNVTVDKNDVVKADKKVDPEKIADEIIMKASKCLYHDQLVKQREVDCCSLIATIIFIIIIIFIFYSLWFLCMK